jgi:hypothetical protein
MHRFYDLTLFCFLFSHPGGFPLAYIGYTVFCLFRFISFFIFFMMGCCNLEACVPYPTRDSYFLSSFLSSPFSFLFHPFSPSFSLSDPYCEDAGFTRLFCFLFFFFRFVIPICDQRWRSYCGGKRGGLLLLPARMSFFFIISIYNLVNIRALIL